MIWIKLLELVDIVPQATSNIDHERGIRRSVCTLKQRFLDGIEGWVHPRCTALPIAAHCRETFVSRLYQPPDNVHQLTVMVCMGTQADGAKVLEAVRQVGVVRCVHRRMGSILRILPIGIAEELVELERAAANSPKPVESSQASSATIPGKTS